ncbi:MAG: hypothetical protein KAR83_05455, partial [Thermodesulfovibrionales bacterium]|nr:hypothetical protein [Thermodesulfovibrionales bacterium]
MGTSEKSIFLSGVGGSGMSAIACLCVDRGMRVKGSDRAFDSDPSHPVAAVLSKRNIVIVPQDGSHPMEDDLLMVMSAAVEDDRPEVLRAKGLGVQIMSRGEYLAEITSLYRTLAVAGTSGKSTTSGMLSYAMGILGLDPAFIGGGRLGQFRAPDNIGNYRRGESGLLVVEACESDGHLPLYRAEHSIIMNIGLDHMGVERTLEMFGALMGNTSGKVVLNYDDVGLASLASLTPGRTIGFSMEAPSDFKAENIELGPLGSCFDLNGTHVVLKLPGIHNIYNALAGMAALSLYGIAPAQAAEAIGGFRGIERRFDIHLNELESGGALVVDDYAHNPHKISFLMRTMREVAPNVTYIFQPHGFGPTRLMRDEYVRVFREHLRPEDRLIVLPIYFVGGT